MFLCMLLKPAKAIAGMVANALADIALGAREPLGDYYSTSPAGPSPKVLKESP